MNQQVLPIAPLHSYLRLLDWFLKIIYSLAAGKCNWSDHKNEGQFIN